MFKKVLIAEDFGGQNLGITQTLREKLNIQEVQDELYCDHAFNRLKAAHTNNEPYELLITDLLFKENHAQRRLTSGVALIDAIKSIQPTLKVIVYSMLDDNQTKINGLFEEQQINGYVCKGRNGLVELIEAVHMVYKNETYLSPQIKLTPPANVFELDDFDLLILKELAEGASKKEVVEKLKSKNIYPNSESTVDKRISKLFDEFQAKNTTHLIVKLTKQGLL